jgi:GNAT superfamily N-acetyltransferase
VAVGRAREPGLPGTCPGGTRDARTSSRQQPIGVAAYSFLVIAIRLAAESDAPALAKIAVAAYQHYVPVVGRPPAPMTADYTAAVRRGQAWVAAVDGEVAGFIILISRPGYLLLENVAVLPDAQGRGIGARLLALAEDRAHALHVPEIRLYTNAAMTENLTYYPQHGYTETHRAQQDGFHRVFFRKRVDT